MRLLRWKMLRWVVLGCVVLLAAIQFVPVDRANPPVETEVPAPAVVRAVLRRSCYDCHSNETVWPWYSKVAPFSWLAARDVNGGRKELNFSTWNRYAPPQQAKKLKECWEEIAAGQMPLWIYLPLHRDAMLSDADRELLRLWTLGGPQASGKGEEK